MQKLERQFQIQMFATVKPNLESGRRKTNLLANFKKLQLEVQAHLKLHFVGLKHVPKTIGNKLLTTSNL